MNINAIIELHPYFTTCPMIDVEFDNLELTSDLKMQIRAAENVTFYKDTLNEEE
jgi:hypothetical protein